MITIQKGTSNVLSVPRQTPDIYWQPNCVKVDTRLTLTPSVIPNSTLSLKVSVSQTVVRGPQAVLGFCPCGPLGLNISPKKKKDIKNNINVNCVSHNKAENQKQFAFKADKSRVVRRTFWLVKVFPTWKKVEKRCCKWLKLFQIFLRVFLYCNHEVHRNFLITLYKPPPQLDHKLCRGPSRVFDECKIQWGLGSRTPLSANNSVHEQFFQAETSRMPNGVSDYEHASWQQR
jgi:hypothetical protein